MSSEAGPSSSAAVPEVAELTGIEALLVKVKSLMNKIKANRDNPSPILLHAISAILDSQKLRFMKEREHNSKNIIWMSHNVGRVMRLIQADNDFLSLICSKYLDDSTYSIAVVAATARLAFSCSTTSTFESELKADILNNIMRWVHDANPFKKLEYDILHTYSIGLLVISLDCHAPLVDTVSTSKLTSKLIRYLSKGVISSNNKKETSKQEDDSLKNLLQNSDFASDQITHYINESLRVAEAEARAANASAAATKRAGEVAVEFIKAAVSEVYKKTQDKDAAVLAASRAASNIKDAADAVSQSRMLNAEVPDIHDNPDEFFLVTFDSLVKLRERFCIQCLMALAVKDDARRPLLRPKGVSVCVELLHTCHEKEHILADVMKLVSILVSNQKFANLFLELGGVHGLLAFPRNAKTYSDLSSCLFRFCSPGRIMERVCALPEYKVHEVIALILEFLESEEDKARHNAASFLAQSFVYKGVIEAFDAHDGLRRLLHHLHIASSEAAALHALPNSLDSIITAAEILIPRIVYQTCHALRLYMRAHLLSVIPPGQTSSLNISNVRKGNQRLDLSDRALDAIFHRIHKDPKLCPAFVSARWPVVDRFLSLNGHITMFKLCQVSAHLEYPCEDLLKYIFCVLHLVTLVPYSRKLIVNLSQGNDRLIDIIFGAIEKQGPLDDRIVEPALQLLANIVSPFPLVSDRPDAVVPPQQPRSMQTGLVAELEQVFREAIEDIRSCGGLRILLELLRPGRKIKFRHPLWRTQLFACRVLVYLARDNSIANLFTQLQVGKKLMELDFETATSSGDVWQAELFQSAAELIAVLTTGSRSPSAIAIDYTTPIWRRIERDSIAEGSSIRYNNSELLHLINEHLFDVGLIEAANVLKAQLMSSEASERKSLQSWPCSPSGVFLDKTAPRRSNLKIKLKDRSGESKGKTSMVLPMKRKSKDSNETMNASLENGLVPNDLKPCSSEKVTLNSIITQYLKQQHHQCQAPITTLPPISLLQPHVCAEPRFGTHESRRTHERGNDHRRFIYSRLRLKRTVHNPPVNRPYSPFTSVKPFFTCLSFLGESPLFAAGCYARKLRVFDYTKGNCISSSRKCHGLRPSLVQSHFLGQNRLILSSSPDEVCLWSGTSLLNGPTKTYEGITGARFSNCGTRFGALQSQSASPPSFEVLLYDVGTSQLRMKLNDEKRVLSPSGRAVSQIHFNPLIESMVLFNGVMWDSRASTPIHYFTEFSDYGGGGFHPIRNEVIINSEVWDIRNLRTLLHSAPSLDQTEITFNPTGDVIYAILRRNRDDVESVLDASRKEHRLFSAFLTVDAVNYSEIARIPVEGGVLDLAVEPSDSYVGVVAMDNVTLVRSSSVRLYEIGRKKASDGDLDDDDVETSAKKGGLRRIPVRHEYPSTGDSDSSDSSDDDDVDDDDDGNGGGDNEDEYEYSEGDGDLVLGPDGHLHFASELMDDYSA